MDQLDTTTTMDTALEVNHFARRSRHVKVFSKATRVWFHFVDIVKWMLSPVNKLLRNRLFQTIGKFLSITSQTIAKAMPVLSPQKKILLQATLLSGTVLIISSLSPGAVFTSTETNYANAYINEYSMPGDVLVADENGYLVKSNPQTDKASRIGMTDYAVHTVEGGESMSVIAEKYGVNVDTIMWENKLGNANALRVGQKLVIPPVSGLSYKIVANDTLEKVAKKYNITKEVIIAQNGLDSEALIKGQTLFLPGAKPLAAPITAIAANRRATAGAVNKYVSANPSDAMPSVGKIFIYPTVGKLTQQFHAGHYALDIADSSRPAIWAAGAGTVVKASSGTWGGGYGNHIIIDHGNGIKTLYAHMTSLNVYEGQYVNQGDVIGIMGNTGRVYGITGIHLHFEVIDHGVKKNPKLYY